jgi:hypothetical protein
MKPFSAISDRERFSTLLDFPDGASFEMKNSRRIARAISCNCAGDHSSFLMMALARTNPARSPLVAIYPAGDAIQRTGG